MKTRIISAAVILPLAIAVLVFLPEPVLVFTVALICVAAAHELIKAVSATCAKTPSPRAAWYPMFASTLIPIIVFLRYLAYPVEKAAPADAPGIRDIYIIGTLTVVLIIMCLLLIDFFLTLKSEKRTRLRQLLVMPFAAIIVPYMLSALIGLRVRPGGYWFVLIPLIITVFTDSGAYFTGKAIGKHKPLPNVSPNKTVEGFIGGIAAGVLSMLIYGLLLNSLTTHSVSVPLLLVCGAVGAVITEFGDLAFSLVKRKCGIKDYGKLIPGHGGILDRLDSLIFNAPAMLLMVTLLPAIT